MTEECIGWRSALYFSRAPTAPLLANSAHTNSGTALQINAFRTCISRGRGMGPLTGFNATARGAPPASARRAAPPGAARTARARPPRPGPPAPRGPARPPRRPARRPAAARPPCSMQGQPVTIASRTNVCMHCPARHRAAARPPCSPPSDNPCQLCVRPAGTH